MSRTICLVNKATRIVENRIVVPDLVFTKAEHAAFVADWNSRKTLKGGRPVTKDDNLQELQAAAQPEPMPPCYVIPDHYEMAPDNGHPGQTWDGEVFSGEPGAVEITPSAEDIEFLNNVKVV